MSASRKAVPTPGVTVPTPGVTVPTPDVTPPVPELLRWFREFGRHDLPWRNEPDPYRVWASEVMLQQTQTATVRGYYARFLEAFPDVRSLAEAQVDGVLRQWEGLGYYRRARAFHAAAQVVMERFGGVIPDTFADLVALPGVGRYTAGAILAFAWERPFPILEANTRRLHARWTGLDLPLDTAEAQARLWDVARRYVEQCGPSVSPRDVNAALMDVGSGVCTPRDARCGECPLRAGCVARQVGAVAQLPCRTRVMEYERRHEIALVMRQRPGSRRVCLRRCGPDERWAGLWDFPRMELPEGADRDAVLRQGVLRMTGLTFDAGTGLVKLGHFRHSVTRFRIELECLETVRTGGRLRGPDVRWVGIGDLDPYPLSVTGRKIARMLVEENTRST